MPETVHRQCTLCEAHCGIDVEVDGDRVLRITGDAKDPISRGYICPKAAALEDLYTDPDRLRRPVRRVGSEWEEIGWDEALDMAADGLRAVQRRHGNDAVATYFGNPSAHTMAVLSGLPLRHVLDTRNHYSATSVDQLPQHLTSAEMFGNLALFPIPDVDRTDYMLILGANPLASNGSLMTAPAIPFIQVDRLHISTNHMALLANLAQVTAGDAADLNTLAVKFHWLDTAASFDVVKQELRKSANLVRLADCMAALPGKKSERALAGSRGSAN